MEETDHAELQYACFRSILGGASDCIFRDTALFYADKGEKWMETRVAIIGIIVENLDMVEQLNELLHDYGKYIIGRMGIPYRKKHICIISIAIDAPQDSISALSGKLGRLPGISTKIAYSGVVSKE